MPFRRLNLAISGRNLLNSLQEKHRGKTSRKILDAFKYPSRNIYMHCEFLKIKSFRLNGIKGDGGGKHYLSKS